jgi:hypothetical protein
MPHSAWPLLHGHCWGLHGKVKFGKGDGKGQGQGGGVEGPGSGTESRLQRPPRNNRKYCRLKQDIAERAAKTCGSGTCGGGPSCSFTADFCPDPPRPWRTEEAGCLNPHDEEWGGLSTELLARADWGGSAACRKDVARIAKAWASKRLARVTGLRQRERQQAEAGAGAVAVAVVAGAGEHQEL